MRPSLRWLEMSAETFPPAECVAGILYMEWSLPRSLPVAILVLPLDDQEVIPLAWYFSPFFSSPEKCLFRHFFFVGHHCAYRGPGSSVSKATGYKLDGPGIEFRWGEIFRTHPECPWGPPSLLYNGYWVYFRWWENQKSLCLKYLSRKIITNCKPCKQWFKINHSQPSSVLQRLPLWWNPINTCVGVYQTWKVIEFYCLLHFDKLYKNQTSKYSNICITSDNNS
jgi:hypothetical protein